jgi:hypothetical protein
LGLGFQWKESDMSSKMHMAAGLGGLLAAFGFGVIQGAVAQEITTEQITANLKAKGYEVYEIEREDDSYEVKARSSEGWIAKLYVDAKTGELLGVEEEDEDNEEEDDEE